LHSELKGKEKEWQKTKPRTLAHIHTHRVQTKNNTQTAKKCKTLHNFSVEVWTQYLNIRTGAIFFIVKKCEMSEEKEIISDD